MENIELKNELNEKLESELKAFMEDLKLKSPEQIMDNSYKLVCMTEIKDYLLYEKNCSNFELKTLLKKHDLLEECYNDWLSSDGRLSEELCFSVDDTIEILRDKEVKKERNRSVR